VVVGVFVLEGDGEMRENGDPGWSVVDEDRFVVLGVVVVGDEIELGVVVVDDKDDDNDDEDDANADSVANSCDVV
jgi:hypothetical protein